LNFENWQPSDSSSLAAAGWATPQWTENIPSYSWDSDDDEKTVIQNQEEGKSRQPLTAPKRMVSIPRKLNMDHFKVHLTSELGKKTGRKSL
jgi:hypothetical protein